MKFIVLAPKNALKYGNVFPLFMQESQGEFDILGCSDVASTIPDAAPLGERWIARYKAQGGTGHYTAAMRTIGITGLKRRIVYGRLLIRRRKEMGMDCIVLGNKSAITYKSVFPLIRERRLRLGARCGGAMFFDTPCGVQQGFGNACWFTNLRHNVRRSLPPLKTMAEKLATNKRLRKHLLEKYGRLEYPRYDNYAAIEVPFVDAIPSDYDGVMGVPVTFLDKWDPDAGMAIEDANEHRVSDSVPRKPHGLVKDKEAAVDGRPTYCRIVIQPRHELVGMAKRGAGDPALKTRIYGPEDGPGYGDWNGTPAVLVDGVPKNTYPRLLIRPAKEIRP